MFASLMASAGPSFKAFVVKSERTQGEKVGNVLGAAAGGCERRKRGRKKNQKWRYKKKHQKYQKLEECLTLEVGVLKVWWKKKHWKG